MTNPEHTRVRVLYSDMFGFARGKYIPMAAATGEAGFSIAIFGVGYDRALVPAPGAEVLEGLGDFRAAYDLDQVRDCWQEGTGVVIADLLQKGQPLAISPRHALVKSVADLEAAGFRARVGTELEAYVLQPDGKGGWEPWDTPGAHCYGTGPLADPAGLLDDIMAAAATAGIGLETIASEYDAPQFEFTIEHKPPLEAIDNTFLLKLLCREVAARHGLLLTFLGRPFGDRGGNGLHVNISLHDDAGQHLFYRPESRRWALRAGPQWHWRDARAPRSANGAVRSHRQRLQATHSRAVVGLLGQLGLRPSGRGDSSAQRPRRGHPVGEPIA